MPRWAISPRQPSVLIGGNTESAPVLHIEVCDAFVHASDEQMGGGIGAGFFNGLAEIGIANRQRFAHRYRV